MNPQLTSPSEVRALLAELGHRPNRGLGQNYLIDANILDGIVQAAELEVGDCVLEVGPGLGALTERILPHVAELTCIEKDETMAAYLRKRLEGVSLLESDALNVDLSQLFLGGVNKVVANLPYSVASRLMVEMAESENRPALMCLTIQKEVADRLTAEAGSRAYGVLSVLMGLFYSCRLVKKVSPTCFLPPPKVWSAVVRLERREALVEDSAEYVRVKRLVKHCFSQRRKQLSTSLKHMGISSPSEVLDRVNVLGSERPERLEPAVWVALVRAIQARGERA